MSVRGYEIYKVTFNNGSAVSNTIQKVDPITGTVGDTVVALEFPSRAIAQVWIPSAWTDAEVGLKTCWYRSETASDYVVFKNENGVYDAGGTQSTVIDGIATAAAGSYFAPPEWSGAGWALLHSVNASTGADVTQGAARVVYVIVKA